MGTIRSAISLYDGVSGPLKNIISTMDSVLDSFEALNRASGESMDTSKVEEMRSALGKAEIKIEEADKAQKKFNASLNSGSGNANNLLSTIKKVAAAVGGLSAVKSVVNLSDELTSTNARLNLLVTDNGSVDELESKIMASAQRSRSSYFDTASAVAKLGLNAGSAFNGDMDQVIAFMEQVNKQFVIGGATAQEQSNAMTQLTQAMAAGALRGEELNSILDGAPGIARAIEKYMGIAEGTIKTVAEKGKVTAEVVKNAMFAVADETNEKFESMPKTWSQIWTSVKNQALGMFEPVLAKINEIFNSERFQTALNSVLGGLSTIAMVASYLMDLMINVTSTIADNWSVIGPAIGVVAGAMLAYKAATVIAAAAQWALNAAMTASPLTWVLVIVTALVAAIAAVSGWVAKTTGIAATGLGVITGGINVAIQTVWNAMLVVANVAIGIWDALSACCSNIGTAFHNVIANVQSWFYGLLSTVLTVVSGICAALNKLPFVEFDYSGISAKAEEYAAKSAEAYDSFEQYTNVGDAFKSGMSTFDTFTDGWASDAFESGSAWGDGVADKVSNLFDSDSLSAFDTFNTLDGIYSNTGSTAANTAATADALEATEEDLAYLRDIAEREAINRFTTAEIHFEQTNNNNISSDTDIDGIMNTWGYQFAEMLDIQGEGVHG